MASLAAEYGAPLRPESYCARVQVAGYSHRSVASLALRARENGYHPPDPCAETFMHPVRPVPLIPRVKG